MLTPKQEALLAQYSAPTLLGAKAASLVVLPVNDVTDIRQLQHNCNRQFARCGLLFRVLKTDKKLHLLLVYRPALLKARLQDAHAQKLLQRFGYPANKGVGPLLDFLCNRMNAFDVFPHEIGLFLDYPPADVEGFIREKGHRCKLCGYWKVYSDVHAAQSRFACYDACKECLCGMVAAGNTLSQLLKAA